MNTRRFFLKIHLIAIILLFESFFMSWAVIISFFNNEVIFNSMINAFLLTFLSGIILFLVSRKLKQAEPNHKDYLLLVALSWLFLGLFGAVPYLLSGTIPNFVNAFFESMSGFTTTGSSILSDIEAMPKSILFWRSLTHWIGGMGIIVLVLAILPFQNMSSKQMFQSEASVVVEEKVSFRIRYIARNIWLIYIGLTVVESILLWFGGMTLFDAVCHSFGTVATGGFSTKNDSVTSFSPFIQYVITIFMILSGINFLLHIFLRKGQFKAVFKNEELIFYLKIIAVVSLLLTVSLHFYRDLNWEHAFRDSFFQVASIITATGFATADYLLWPTHGILLIAFLMFIGACAGSTGGGVKVIRNLIVVRKFGQSFRQLINPNAVCEIRYNQKIIKTEQVRSIITFVLVYYLVIAIGTSVLLLLGLDFGTSFGSSITTLGGIGPGFGTVGPAANFAHLPDAAKLFLSFNMLTGRLEIYAALVMLNPGFWKN